MGNFSEYFTSVDKLALSENISTMWSPCIISISPFSPPLALSKPRLTDALYWGWPQHELPGLTGRHYVFQNDLSWNICSLTRLTFPLFPFLHPHPFKLLTVLLVHPTLTTLLREQPFSANSLITFVSRDTHQVQTLTLLQSQFLFFFPPSQPQELCYQALSLCPTLVYQKSGAFSQPWMSKSMCLDQATVLGAKQSEMRDELWNPFPDKFRISDFARAPNQWMGTCVTKQKIFHGKCLRREICSLLLRQTKDLMKSLSGSCEKKIHLCFKFRVCLRFS